MLRKILYLGVATCTFMICHEAMAEECFKACIVLTATGKYIKKPDVVSKLCKPDIWEGPHNKNVTCEYYWPKFFSKI